jgi:hypothetical protein
MHDMQGHPAKPLFNGLTDIFENKNIQKRICVTRVAGRYTRMSSSYNAFKFETMRAKQIAYTRKLDIRRFRKRNI